MGYYCCMHINEFQDDQPTGEEQEVVNQEQGFTPEEAAALAE